MQTVLSLIVVALTVLTALIPAPVAAGPALQTSPATHVVVKGDTLYSIAKRYGTTASDLMRLNRLNNAIIYEGQILRVASSSPTAGRTTYTVVAGDTLFSLARRHGTSVEAIMRANGLAGTLIIVGQLLLIPSSPASGKGTVHTVVRGDTLYSIARRYHTSMEAIMAANELPNFFIYAGQRLIIPQAKATSTLAASPTATTTPATTGTPTPTPTPTVTTTPQTGANVIIVEVSPVGTGTAQPDEYVVISNIGSASQDMSDWLFNAGDPDQDFTFPSGFVMAPGQTCRIYTNEINSAYCGLSFGINEPIWDNDEDQAYLYDENGTLVDEYEYP